MALEQQNDYTLRLVRMVKKMLINQGTPIDEIDKIIEEGNLKKEEEISDPYNKKLYEDMKKQIEDNKKQ